MTIPLRILMTTDAVGGVWVYATELACSLCNGGNEVMLAVIGPRERLAEEAAGAVGIDARGVEDRGSGDMSVHACKIGSSGPRVTCDAGAGRGCDEGRAPLHLSGSRT